MLTTQQLDAMAPMTVFAQGEIKNSPEGVYMTDSNAGRMMVWTARRGEIADWTIYIHWASNGIDFCLNNGDKVTSKHNIEKLVPCNPEALSRYRY